MEKVFYNPSYRGEQNLDEHLKFGINSSIVIGSQNFFDMLSNHVPLKEGEEILVVSVTDTTINVVFRKKDKTKENIV